MIRAKNGALYQWDLNRIVEIDDEQATVSEIQVASLEDTEAMVVPFERRGKKVECCIPNILLQSASKIAVYVISSSDETRTLNCKVFHVAKKPKPSGYVYTESEVLTYATLEEKIEQLKESLKIEQSDIELAVENYLLENPVPEAEISAESISNALGYTPADADITGGCTLVGSDISFNTQGSDTSLSLLGGGDTTKGASLVLYGNDSSGSGCFRLQTYDEESGEYRALEGMPDGSLMWNGAYLNPPMVAGTEYRTFERYEGKPVYVKLIDVGNLPNKDRKSVSTGINGGRAFDMSFSLHMGSNQLTHMPYVSTSFAAITRAYLEAGGSFIIETNSDLSAYTMKLTVKYTKS